MRLQKDFRDLERVDKELMYAKNHYILIGFISEKYNDGVNVREYALWNEYGTLYIPARPFFRRATNTRKAKRLINNYAKRQIGKVIDTRGHFTMEQAYNAIGVYVVGQIQKSIKRGNWQQNAPSTVRRKGKSNPLIDSGSMINAVSFEIRRR